VARLCVPTLGTACAIDLVGEDGRLAQVAGDAAWSGQQAVIPLPARGRVLGALRLRTPEPLPVEDLSLAEELGRRVGLALENVRLLEAERRARAAAEAAQREAQEAAHLREKVLSVVTHDLRSPLQTILLTGELIRRTVDQQGGSFDWLTRSVRRIEKAANSMNALVAEMLDVACLQAGQRLMLDLRPTDLLTLVRQVVEDMGDMAARIKVETAGSDLVGLWDPPRIERVVGNLLGNAIKFSPGTRDISLRISRRGCPGGECAILDVQDRGLGIPPGDLPHVFDWFRRGQNVIGRIPGTGVGLASARQIVEQHGGTIDVTSEIGVGTIFSVSLPLVAQSETQAAGGGNLLSHPRWSSGQS
jgi:signal transduction histidine kinase